MFTGIVTVKLSEIAKWEGREISTAELDFGKVTGAVINRCERETFGGGNMSTMMRPFSSDYCARLAAEISDIPFRAIEKLPYYDFEKVWQTVAAFVIHKNPQEFYDQFTKSDDDEGFMRPAEEQKTMPAELPEPEEVKKTTEKPAAK